MTGDVTYARLGFELIRKFSEAAETSDMTHVVEAAEFMIATGLFPYTRGQLLASYWFKANMQNRRKSRDNPGKYVLLGSKLLDQGYCTEYELNSGMGSVLVALGERQGYLPGPLYDLMVSCAPPGFDGTEIYSNIQRVEID